MSDGGIEMASIKRGTGVLKWLRCPAECLKNDWNSEYQHMGVVQEDHFLQVIEWCLDVNLPLGVGGGILGTLGTEVI